MSNNLKGRMWQLTDPSVGDPVKSGLTFIKSVVWQGYTSATHRATLVDGDGVRLFDSPGRTNLEPIQLTYDSGGPFRDVTLEQLDSGLLNVEIL